jgi:hypothetical protein
MLVNVIESTVQLLQALLIDWPIAIAKALWETGTALLRLFLVDIPHVIWELSTSAIEASLKALEWLLTEGPELIWSTLVFVVKLPRVIGEAMWQLVRAFGDALGQLLREVMQPVGDAFTWALAVAIAPFYLLWRIAGLGGHEGPNRPGGQPR